MADWTTIFVFALVGSLFAYGIMLNRFSLKSLLIATTLIALVLGLTSAIVRAIH